MRIQVLWDVTVWLGEWLLILQSWWILICRSDVAEGNRMPHFCLPPPPPFPKKLRFNWPALFKVTTIAATATETKTKINKERRKERKK
jgi:hypothetical protein